MKEYSGAAGVWRSMFKVRTICCVALTGFAEVAARALAGSQSDAILRVETTNAILSFKAGSCDLIGMRWKRPKLDLIAEPKLGENFRILLPRPDYEANYFESRDQAVRKIERFPDRIVLHYGPLKNAREEIDVHVTYEIRDTGKQLQFSVQVDNPTDRPLAEVLYGILGGQQGIGERLDTESLIPGGFYNNLAPKLFTQFVDVGEDVGIRFPSAGYAYPGTMAMGWMDVFNRKAGMGYYYGNQDPETRVSSLYLEMHPYTTRATASADNWPSAATLPSGEPRGLTIGWVNFPYTARGQFRAGPIALQVHEGDWHAAAPIYRAWFDQHFQVPRTPNWVRREMAWSSVVLMNPEDSIHYRYNDLPKLAADAKRYGVTTLNVYGWHMGGLERNNPDFAPDPRLGTVEEFRQALAGMRALGVHSLMWVNSPVADTGTEAFRRQLSRYAVYGRWAPDWRIMGTGEATIGARMFQSYGGTVHHNYALMSLSHSKFREAVIGPYLDRIADGVEGLESDVTDFVDVLDFNPNLSVSPDRSLPQGVLKTFEELLRRAQPINPDFALVGAYSDRAYPYVQVSRNYLLDAKDASAPAVPYTFPEHTSMVYAESPGNFDRLNNGLRYGLVWIIAPRRYTASMDEELTRPLSRYVSELIRIRKQHAELLFHGRFNEMDGATVQGDAQNIRYSVFNALDPKNSSRACVVINFGEHEEETRIDFPGMTGRKVTVNEPFKPDREEILPVKLTLPAHRAVVVVISK